MPRQRPVEALASLKNRKFEIDSLMLIAAAGAAALGAWAEGAQRPRRS
jgi:Cd2+/Zn2+-exporting ATPase